MPQSHRMSMPLLPSRTALRKNVTQQCKRNPLSCCQRAAAQTLSNVDVSRLAVSGASRRFDVAPVHDIDRPSWNSAMEGKTAGKAPAARADARPQPDQPRRKPYPPSKGGPHATAPAPRPAEPSTPRNRNGVHDHQNRPAPGRQQAVDIFGSSRSFKHRTG